MNQIKNETAEEWTARVQRMAKWIAGHAVEVHTRRSGSMYVRVGEEKFEVLNANTFPDENTIARCALALNAMGIGDRFQVGDFDRDTLMRFIPPSVSGKWDAGVIANFSGGW